MRLDFTAFSFGFSGQRHPGDGSMEIKAGLRVDEMWRGLSCVTQPSPFIYPILAGLLATWAVGIQKSVWPAHHSDTHLGDHRNARITPQPLHLEAFMSLTATRGSLGMFSLSWLWKPAGYFAFLVLKSIISV